MPDPPVKASWWEIVGAWLGIWTPPIGAEIPPVPWRRLGAGVLALVAVGVVIALVAGDNRQANARQQATNDAAAKADRADRAAYEQRLIEVRIDPAADPVREAEQAVLEEAQARHAAGEIATAPEDVRCATRPGSAPDTPRRVLNCDVKTSDVIRDGERVGQLSVPFRAVATADRLALCAINPPAGEQALVDPRDIVRVPKACRP